MAKKKKRAVRKDSGITKSTVEQITPGSVPAAHARTVAHLIFCFTSHVGSEMGSLFYLKSFITTNDSLFECALGSSRMRYTAGKGRAHFCVINLPNMLVQRL